MNVDDIMIRLIPSRPPSGASEDRDYAYHDEETGRQFNIRQYGIKNARYFLEEMIPNGRMFSETNGKATNFWDEPLIEEIEKCTGSNSLLSELRKHGINSDMMILISGGIGVGSIYYDSLRACAKMIADSLTNDVRYKGFRQLSAEEKNSLDAAEKKASIAYWERESNNLIKSVATEDGLFKGCYTMMGEVLSEDSKMEILGYLNAPSQELWLDIRGKCIVGHITLWQAWNALSSDAPTSGSTGYPDPETLRQAIRYAVHIRQQKIDEVNELQPPKSPNPLRRL